MRDSSRGSWMVVCAALAIGCGQESSIERPSGRLELRTLDDVRALAGSRSIDGDLWITDSKLETLHGLEQLESVRYLVIGGNAELASLAGLGLREAQGVTLWNNPKLVDIAQLSSIEQLPALALLGGNALSPSSVAELPPTVELSVLSSDVTR